MNYRYCKVSKQLAGYVRTAIVLDDRPVDQLNDLPLYTNGMPALVCRHDHEIILYGESVPDEEWKSDTRPPVVFFFHPFALAPTFKLQAKELKEKSVSLNLWNAQKAMALNIQLHSCNSSKEKAEALSHFIYNELESNKRDCEIIRQATDAIMQDYNADVLPALLEKLNLTERTFQRLFKKYVGVSPNEYRRLCQWYFAFSQLQSGHFDKLSDVAYANGYFDQSHYIRAFKEFAKTTPNDYLQSGLGNEK